MTAETENECVHILTANKTHYRCKSCKAEWPKQGHDVPPGPGSQLYQKLHSMGLPECDSCEAAAFQMDLWGERGCQQNKTAILKRLKKELWRISLTGKIDSVIENWLVSEGIIKWDST